MFPLDRELWLGVVHLWEGKVPGQVKLGCQDSVCESRSVLCSSLLVTPWTVAHWAPLSVGFSRQEYWSGLPCPPPGHLPHPGIELAPHVSCIGRWVLYQSTTWGAPLTPG